MALGSCVHWVIKVSKLCNLRCPYCYEWNDLASNTRMTLEQWHALLLSIREYHEYRAQRCSPPFETRIVWHGGEPLLLPVDYVNAVLDLQHEVLGEDLEAAGYFNTLQTNLFRLTGEWMDALVRHRIHLGVSMDVVSGVRVDAAGRETEDRVAANIDRLRDAGIPFGAIVVLAGHTHERVCDIYDFFEALQVGVRFLPLFDAPLNVPQASFAVTEDQVVTALQRLFRHWMTRSKRVPINPLREYAETVVLAREKRIQTRYDRESYGEWALLANTDGTLYEVQDAYEHGLSLGNVFTQRLSAIMQSHAYSASLARERTLRAKHCGTCEYLGPCTTVPLLDSPRRDFGGDRCFAAHRMIKFVDDFARDQAIPLALLRELAYTN